MNREIKKFNVWDSVAKQWWIKDATLWDLFAEIQKDVLFREIDWSSLKERLIFLLSTGLHDNTKWEQLTKDEQDKWLREGNTKENWNGKEIYEGDIMYFNKQEGVWSDQVNKNIIVKYPFLCGNSNLGEVIGNVMENPELLK